MTQTGGSQSRRRRTGLGWPKRLRPSRLLGWPKVSRETTPAGGATTATTPDAEPARSDEGGRGSEAPAEEGDDDRDLGEYNLPTPPAESVPAGFPENVPTAAPGVGTEHSWDFPDGAKNPPGDTPDDKSSAAVPDNGALGVSDAVSAAPDEEGQPDEGEGSGDPTAPRHAVSDPDTGFRSLDDHGDGSNFARRAPNDGPDVPVEPTGPVNDDPDAPPSGSKPADNEAATAVSRETSSPAVRAMPKPAQTRTLVIANQKGGVGKTTTSVNLATALALGGMSTLVIDLDPQANASTALGIDHPRGRPGTYEVLINGDAIADHVEESPEAAGLIVLPSTVDLAGAEIELVSVVARENRLKRALTAYLSQHPTDYVLLDCPPSLGLLTVNALVAANEVLIPIQCEYYALEGVSQLVNTIDLVSGELNNELRLSTVLLTMYDARTRLAAQVADEVRAHFTDQTLATLIPRSVRISEAPSYGKSVLTYHPESTGAVSYLDAAGEIARRGAKENA